MADGVFAFWVHGNKKRKSVPHCKKKLYVVIVTMLLLARRSSKRVSPMTGQNSHTGKIV